ncbi:minor capsid protein [Clostridium sp.]|uniref:minor capsid protein n=1 Tax=Clostridium sp. TaxID=1506 RepID=UPI003994EFBE
MNSNQQANNIWSIYNKKEQEKIKWLLIMYVWLKRSRKIAEELHEIQHKNSTEYKHYRSYLLHLVHETLEQQAREINYTICKHLEEVYKEIFKQVAKDLDNEHLQMPSRSEIYKLTHEIWVGDKNFEQRTYWNINQVYEKYLDIVKSDKKLDEKLKELDKLQKNYWYRIHRLVRTETMHVINIASMRVYRACGIGLVKWITCMDERTCKVCASRDEVIYPIDMCPLYPDHPNCRCLLVAVQLKRWR